MKYLTCAKNLRCSNEFQSDWNWSNVDSVMMSHCNWSEKVCYTDYRLNLVFWRMEMEKWVLVWLVWKRLLHPLQNELGPHQIYKFQLRLVNNYHWSIWKCLLHSLQTELGLQTSWDGEMGISVIHLRKPATHATDWTWSSPNIFSWDW